MVSAKDLQGFHSFHGAESRFEGPTRSESPDGLLVGNFSPHGDFSAAELLQACLRGEMESRLRDFKGEYAFAFLDRRSGTLALARDPAGVQPLYYTQEGGRLFFGSKVNAVLERRTRRAFSSLGVSAFLFYEFIPEPHTLFEGVFQVPRGGIASFEKSGERETRIWHTPLATIDEYEESPAEIFAQLRQHIVDAYLKRLGPTNGLYLSGGIDSNVGAVVLKKILGLQEVHSFTFRVKGAEQSESHVAEKAAASLSLQHETVEVDPRAPVDFPALVQGMNFPYFAVIHIDAIGRRTQDLGLTGLTLFTGQDTRLHTPHLNPIDRLALGHLAHHPAARSVIASLAGVLSHLPLPERLGRGMSRLSKQSELSNYLLHYFFHRHNRTADAFGRNLGDAELLQALSDLLGHSRSLRTTFNGIVDLSWDRQYTDDISYMRDATALRGNLCRFPYYDLELARYSAGIPFELALKLSPGVAGHGKKRKIVDKYVLRNAFKGELSDDLIMRDKAVCVTNHLFLNGCLKPYLDEYLAEPALRNSPLYERFGLEELRLRALERSGKWTMSLADYLDGVEVLNLLALETLARTYGIR
ncbi:MAG TPA: asparagine synthase-related protein [Chroococcales cyanobacterium]